MCIYYLPERSWIDFKLEEFLSQTNGNTLCKPNYYATVPLFFSVLSVKSEFHFCVIIAQLFNWVVGICLISKMASVYKLFQCRHVQF
jgi:hypothetical protein